MTLSARTLGVRFGGVQALLDVDLELAPGQIHGVIGPNGSGKSTLFNLLSGFVMPTTGQVVIDGVDVTRLAPHRRIGMGIGRTFQTPRFDPATTVRETIACGYFPSTRSAMIESAIWDRRVRREERLIDEGVTELLDLFGLVELAEREVGHLPLGKVRLVEVARAMATRPRYLLLDEPAAGLSIDEQDVLIHELRRLAGSEVGLLLVEHNFDLVTGVCETITVLNNGQVLVRGPAADVAVDPRVAEAYLGIDDEDSEESSPAPPAPEPTAEATR